MGRREFRESIAKGPVLKVAKTGPKKRQVSDQMPTNSSWFKCAMVKSRYIGDGHPTFNRNPYNGYINPYYWVDDHPLLYGNNGSLDPGTNKLLQLQSRIICTCLFGCLLLVGDHCLLSLLPAWTKQTVVQKAIANANAKECHGHHGPQTGFIQVKRKHQPPLWSHCNMSLVSEWRAKDGISHLQMVRKGQ